MARPTSREAQFSNTLPASVRGVDRRSLLRGAIGAGALFGGASLLGACGSDPAPVASGGASAKAGPVSFGINEAKGFFVLQKQFVAGLTLGSTKG